MLTVNKSLGYLFILTLIAGLVTILLVQKTYSAQFEIDQELMEIYAPIEKKPNMQ
jgi:hypothetical protein